MSEAEAGVMITAIICTTLIVLRIIKAVAGDE
jgi:hypothetical protein